MTKLSSLPLPIRNSVWPDENPLIEQVALADLQPNPKNSRTHSNRQLKKIRRSIKTLGALNPLIIDENNVILAGNGRAEAARQEGLTHFPAIRYGHLTDEQKRAYVIADNKIAQEAGWDREMLAIELGELVELLPAKGLDVALTGFDVGEIDIVLSDFADNPPPADDIPSPPDHPTTCAGDLWLLGKNRLLCGDARDPNSFTQLMAGTTAAAVFCDPPYNLAVKRIGGRGRIRHAEFACASGEMSRTQFRQFLTQTLGHGLRVSAPGAVHYVCMDWRHVGDLIAVGHKLYESMLNLVVWNKTNAGQGSFYRSQHELIGVFLAAGGGHQNNVELGRFGRNRSNVWTYGGINTFGRGRIEALSSHPTVKPIALVADALLDCTKRGDVILDQFTGSGTAILAAEKVGRRAYGLEIEPRYVDVAITRWQQTTKLDALLAGDGRTFDEVSVARTQTPALCQREGGDHG
jgi:DNA modification methylase